MYTFIGGPGDSTGSRSRIKIVKPDENIDSPTTGTTFSGDLFTGAAVVTGVPFTMACWASGNTLNSSIGSIIGIGRRGSQDTYGATLGTQVFDYQMGYQSTHVQGGITGSLSARIRNGTNVQTCAINYVTAGVTNNVPFHIAASFIQQVGNTTRATVKLYVNGVLQQTLNTNANRPELNATVISFGGFNKTSIGCMMSNNSSNGFTGAENYWAGQIGEVGIWDVELNADEIASLSQGFRCDKVRPTNLKLYMPLAGERNVAAGNFKASFEGTGNQLKPAPGTGNAFSTMPAKYNENRHPRRYG